MLMLEFLDAAGNPNTSPWLARDSRASRKASAYKTVVIRAATQITLRAANVDGTRNG